MPQGYKKQATLKPAAERLSHVNKVGVKFALRRAANAIKAQVDEADTVAESPEGVGAALAWHLWPWSAWLRC